MFVIEMYFRINSIMIFTWYYKRYWYRLKELHLFRPTEVVIAEKERHATSAGHWFGSCSIGFSTLSSPSSSARRDSLSLPLTRGQSEAAVDGHACMGRGVPRATVLARLQAIAPTAAMDDGCRLPPPSPVTPFCLNWTFLGGGSHDLSCGLSVRSGAIHSSPCKKKPLWGLDFVSSWWKMEEGGSETNC
jgi:hypothetical protein